MVSDLVILSIIIVIVVAVGYYFITNALLEYKGEQPQLLPNFTFGTSGFGSAISKGYTNYTELMSLVGNNLGSTPTLYVNYSIRRSQGIQNATLLYQKYYNNVSLSFAQSGFANKVIDINGSVFYVCQAVGQGINYQCKDYASFPSEEFDILYQMLPPELSNATRIRLYNSGLENYNGQQCTLLRANTTQENFTFCMSAQYGIPLNFTWTTPSSTVIFSEVSIGTSVQAGNVTELPSFSTTS